MSGDSSPELLREHDAIDGQRAAAGNPRRVRRLEHDAAELPHLGLEQAVRVRRFDRFEGVAADQLGEAFGLMGRRHADRPHLVQRYTYAPLGEGPGGFTAREAAPDHMYGHDMPCPYVVTSSVSGADSSTTIVCAHLRHLRVVSPVVLDLISSMPTNPQLGHGTRTGLFQVE